MLEKSTIHKLQFREDGVLELRCYGKMDPILPIIEEVKPRKIPESYGGTGIFETYTYPGLTAERILQELTTKPELFSDQLSASFLWKNPGPVSYDYRYWHPDHALLVTTSEEKFHDVERWDDLVQQAAQEHKALYHCEVSGTWRGAQAYDNVRGTRDIVLELCTQTAQGVGLKQAM